MPATGGESMGTVHARDLHRRAVSGVAGLVQTIPPDGWDRPTPCEGWDVRQLVHHLVEENRWTPPLMGGATIEEVGDALSGDLLGDDPVGAWHAAAAAGLAATYEPGAMERTVHLSFGDTPAEEYVMQLFADHLIHGWDLAEALGIRYAMEPDLVDACVSWFDGVEADYRAAGVIGERVDVAPGADPQVALLARFGRAGTAPAPDDPDPTRAAVDRLNAAFERHDVDAVVAAFTEDAVFENTAPAPDGVRVEGTAALRDFWKRFFDESPAARFAPEEVVVAGDRAVVRWRYDWVDPAAGPGHVRGVDVLRVRDGRVAEKLAYVKG